MILNEYAEKTLARIETCTTWLSSVGIVDYDTNLYEPCLSWKAASEYCSSLKWENFILGISNYVSDSVLSKDKSRFNQRNYIVHEIKPRIESVVDTRIAPLIPFEYLEEISSEMKNFLLLAGIEACYIDLLEINQEDEFVEKLANRFFSRVLEWYFSGHIPCYWQGPINRTKGRLVIF